MADPFDSAASKIDEQKRAVLAAMAQAGSAGKAAYEQARTRIAAQRQAALAAALGGADERGLNPELQAQLSAKITAGLDRQAADLSASEASYAGQQSTIGQASDSYLSEAAAAIPSLRARSERQVAALRAKAEEDEADRQLKRQLAEFGFARDQTDFENDQVLADLGLRKAQLGFDQDLALGDIDLQKALLGLEGDRVGLTKAQVELAKKQAAGGGGSGGTVSDAELRVRLLGAARIANELGREGEARRVAMGAAGPAYKPPTDEALARQLGLGAGVDPARVYGVVADPKPTAPNKPPVVAKYVRDEWRDSVAARALDSASRSTFEELETAVAKGKDKPGALRYVAKLSDSYLAKRGISRNSLLGWVNQFYAKG